MHTVAKFEIYFHISVFESIKIADDQVLNKQTPILPNGIIMISFFINLHIN